MTLKIVSWIMFAVLVCIGVTLIVGAIMAHYHDVGLFAEMDNWFHAVKDTLPENEKVVEEVVKNALFFLK